MVASAARSSGGAFRVRAVRLVAEARPEHDTDWAANTSVATKPRVSTETVRNWVRRAEIDSEQRPGTTSEESAKPKRLRRENTELRRANETSHAAGRQVAAAVTSVGVAGKALFLVIAGSAPLRYLFGERDDPRPQPVRLLGRAPLHSPVVRIKTGLSGEACIAVSCLVASCVRLRRLPVPGRGDRGGGPLVPRYGLSYRDVEELLAERGIEVDHVTVYRWVQRFTPMLADAARFCRHAPGDRWFVDETYVKVNGVWRYVYRAIDQHGQVIEVLLSARRDAATARRFFTRALRTLNVAPREVVTDAAPVYPGVLDELVPAAWHHVEQYATDESDRSGS
jgi:transposase-like protein